MNLRQIFLGLSVVCLLGSAAQADDLIHSDVKGIADHPALKRFEGSVLVAGDKRSFDEYTVALGRVEFDYNAQQFKEWPRQKVEGALHTAFYRMPKDVTTLEALKNYENDLNAKGFELLFTGSGTELDNGYGRFVSQVYTTLKDSYLMQYVLPSAKDFRYLVLRKTNEDGSQVVFSGLFALVSDGWGSKYAKVGDVLARIDLVETRAMKQRMVTVKAEEMARQIDASGRVALYGILFDFNKADVKPESAPALAEVAKYMNSGASVKLLVVGHTDNVGNFEVNRDLSERRARAVVEYLVSHHTIDRERLFSFGVSFAAPAAANDTEEGKAKNRRVELVKF
jgi:OmpA-OmpF porin, OOP family